MSQPWHCWPSSLLAVGWGFCPVHLIRICNNIHRCQYQTTLPQVSPRGQNYPWLKVTGLRYQCWLFLGLYPHFSVALGKRKKNNIHNWIFIITHVMTLDLVLTVKFMVKRVSFHIFHRYWVIKWNVYYCFLSSYVVLENFKFGWRCGAPWVSVCPEGLRNCPVLSACSDEWLS